MEISSVRDFKFCRQAPCVVNKYGKANNRMGAQATRDEWHVVVSNEPDTV